MFKLDTVFTREDIEQDAIIMKVSNDHNEYIVPYTKKEHLNFYVPVGYEGWELKEYKSDTICSLVILVSPTNEVVLAPYQHGYAQEVLDDMIDWYIDKEVM